MTKLEVVNVSSTGYVSPGPSASPSASPWANPSDSYSSDSNEDQRDDTDNNEEGDEEEEKDAAGYVGSGTMKSSLTVAAIRTLRDVTAAEVHPEIRGKGDHVTMPFSVVHQYNRCLEKNDICDVASGRL
jgi:hypothetical protein